MREQQESGLLTERRSGVDRRRAAERRRGSAAPEGVRPEPARTTELLAITTSILLAPRLQQLEFRDSPAVRNMVEQALNVAKMLLRKIEPAQPAWEEESVNPKEPSRFKELAARAASKKAQQSLRRQPAALN
jgi:hypothetical protein